MLALFWGYTGSKKCKQQHISAYSSKHAGNSTKRLQIAPKIIKLQKIFGKDSKLLKLKA